jgi:hypothetical protein
MSSTRARTHARTHTHSHSHTHTRARTSNFETTMKTVLKDSFSLALSNRSASQCSETSLCLVVRHDIKGSSPDQLREFSDLLPSIEAMKHWEGCFTFSTQTNNAPFLMRPASLILLRIYRVFPAALGPGVYSTSNRNEYQKH